MSKARANADATSQAYIENATATQNLSGTYSTERLYFNDSYTLTGDVTVTGHLALGTVADSDVVITQDSTERTITGSGTLESGNVLQDTHRTSLTDMTGELGSVVTGSPNLNLGNATGTLGSGVTFPAGHIVKFEKVVTQPTSTQGGSTTYSDLTGSSITYTPATGASWVVYSCQFHYGGDNSGNEDMALWHIMYDGTAEYGTQGMTYLSVSGSAWAVGQKTHQYIRQAWSGSKTIKIRQRAYSAYTHGWFHRQTYGSADVANEAAPNSNSNHMKVYTTIYSVM